MIKRKRKTESRCFIISTIHNHIFSISSVRLAKYLKNIGNYAMKLTCSPGLSAIFAYYLSSIAISLPLSNVFNYVPTCIWFANPNALNLSTPIPPRPVARNPGLIQNTLTPSGFSGRTSSIIIFSAVLELRYTAVEGTEGYAVIPDS